MIWRTYRYASGCTAFVSHIYMYVYTYILIYTFTLIHTYICILIFCIYVYWFYLLFNAVLCAHAFLMDLNSSYRYWCDIHDDIDWYYLRTLNNITHICAICTMYVIYVPCIPIYDILYIYCVWIYVPCIWIYEICTLYMIYVLYVIYSVGSRDTHTRCAERMLRIGLAWQRLSAKQTNAPKQKFANESDHSQKDAHNESPQMHTQDQFADVFLHFLNSNNIPTEFHQVLESVLGKTNKLQRGIFIYTLVLFM